MQPEKSKEERAKGEISESLDAKEIPAPVGQ